MAVVELEVEDACKVMVSRASNAGVCMMVGVGRRFVIALEETKTTVDKTMRSCLLHILASVSSVLDYAD